MDPKNTTLVLCHSLNFGLDANVVRRSASQFHDAERRATFGRTRLLSYDNALVSGRIVAEFEDDASQFLSGEPEFVRAPEPTAVMPATAAVPPASDGVQGKPG